jgi:hypothetical protein
MNRDKHWRYTNPRTWKFDGETNDCTVRALAIAADLPYPVAHAVLAKHGRAPRRGCVPDVSFPAYAELGFRPVQLKFVQTQVYRRSHSRQDRTGYTHYIQPTVAWMQRTELTLCQFLKQNPVGRFIVHVRRHAIAVVDGVVMDSLKFRPRQYVECYFTLN